MLRLGCSRPRCSPSFPAWTCSASRLLRQVSSARELIKVSDTVQDALSTGKPVVALETTIYTHGFPYPQNVALSSHLESLVRVNGGVPATIGILDGVARVGMEAEELIRLVSAAGEQKTWKISRRDLAFIGGLGLRGQKLNGGTTIAGTMVLAHLAGIKILATGGLGGVHRGGQHSLDVSADLTELGRTAVAVISSGCKSFLDMPRTLEYLETQGVGVGTFLDGRQGEVDFPAFFSRDSGVRSPRSISDEAEAAAIAYAQFNLPLRSGLLFANPVPEDAGLSKSEMDVIIKMALDEADLKGIAGAENTPYVLKRIEELSRGRSVVANRALISANVVRGTKVAVELAKLEQDGRSISERYGSSPSIPNSTPSNLSTNKAARPHHVTSTQEPAQAWANSTPAKGANTVDILVAGSIASDLMCDYEPLQGHQVSDSPALHTSNPAIITPSPGGVGYNVARAADYAGASVALASVVADDIIGTSLLDQVRRSGMSIDAMHQLPTTTGARTAQYVAVNDTKRDLVLAMADMSILASPALESPKLWHHTLSTHNPKWLVVDANWSPAILSTIITTAKSHNPAISIAFEPVSTQKATRLFQPKPILTDTHIIPNNLITLATPNTFELQAMYHAARSSQLFDSHPWWRVINSLGLGLGVPTRDRLTAITTVKLVDAGIPQQSIQLLPYMPTMLVKLGAHGCLLTSLLPPNDPRLSEAASAPFILARADSDVDVDVDVRVGGVYMRLFPPSETLRPEEVVSVNGVGDTLLGVLITGLVTNNGNGNANKRIEEMIPLAQHAAMLTLRSNEAVSPLIQQMRWTP